ncbi:sensor histidine kinase [Paenibacillus filicis]|uniref:histidine kinase n=1 Tax=Paenibacillus filicis TaxID=669464 RepID=A0ABU9DLE7_9BACL
MDIFLEAIAWEQKLLVSVRDEGIGIAPEHVDAIFQRTYRVHPADLASGNGLGLPIAREIAKRHGGSIRVESGPGEGSRFVLTLPAFKR